ncbi:MAG: hypothetical protein MK212_09260 [Saprospiraceae bacterium]|nr:hypothetical protein [Saprospiraceae bacterium]
MRTFLFFLLAFVYGAVCGAVYLWIMLNGQITVAVMPSAFHTFIAIVVTQVVGSSIYQAYDKGKTFFDFLKKTIPFSVISGLGLLVFNLVRMTVITRGSSPNNLLVLTIFGSLILFLMISVVGLVASLPINTLVWRYALPDVHNQNSIHSDLLDESIEEEKKKRWQ